MKKLVYIAKNSDSIEDGQTPNCRLKISIIIIEDVIGRLTNYYISGPKVGLNICDLHKGTLKKNHQFLSEDWVYMILWGPVDP